MYRTEPPEIPEPIGRAVDRSRHSEIKITNGITSRIAFPCYYMYRKDGEPWFPKHRIPPIIQDHNGWPAPDHRDQSFQPRMLEGFTVDPIHLEEEGYDTVIMAFEDKPSGLTYTTEIDDFIIRITLSSMCSEADTSEIEVPFSMYLSGNLVVDDVSHAARDLVTSGIIRILPAIHV